MLVVSCVPLFATPLIVARQAPLSREFSSQDYWSGLPLPTLGNLPNPGIKPISLASPAWAVIFFTTEPPRKPYYLVYFYLFIFTVDLFTSGPKHNLL